MTDVFTESNHSHLRMLTNNRIYFRMPSNLKSFLLFPFQSCFLLCALKHLFNWTKRCRSLGTKRWQLCLTNHLRALSSLGDYPWLLSTSKLSGKLKHFHLICFHECNVLSWSVQYAFEWYFLPVFSTWWLNTISVLYELFDLCIECLYLLAINSSRNSSLVSLLFTIMTKLIDLLFIEVCTRWISEYSKWGSNF